MDCLFLIIPSVFSMDCLFLIVPSVFSNVYYLQKTKHWATWITLKPDGELRHSGRVGSSCSTSGTPRVSLVAAWNINESKTLLV
jgi:hypothetical protein